jgi:hypothetical protein
MTRQKCRVIVFWDWEYANRGIARFADFGYHAAQIFTLPRRPMTPYSPFAFLRVPKSDRKASPHQGEFRLKLWLFCLVIASVILLGGGRIVSSDETSTFLTIESIVKYGKLDIPVHAPNVTVHEGKAYTWYEPGISVAGLPFFVVGHLAGKILPLSPAQEELFLRAVVSCASSFVAGWLAVMFYGLCRRFRLSAGQALSATLALIFSTFLFPYFKTFLREPLLTLCLLGGMSGVMEALHSAERRWPLTRAGLFLGFGVLTKSAFLINVVPILIYLAVDKPEGDRRSPRKKAEDFLTLGVPIVIVGLGGLGLYNMLRFGNVLAAGYSGGTTFSTPLMTGLFGLLLSPGKGLFWFAPILLLLLWAFKPFWQQHRNEAGCIAAIAVLNLLLHGLYVAWGGDGSWGPRYLAPLLPLLCLPVAVFVGKSQPATRRIALGLVVVGGVIQIGGTAVYAGSYLREIGEFPYQRNFDDPEFLYRAHFVPDFSPILGHWKVLMRNGKEHLQGDYPRFAISATPEGSRLPVQQEDQQKLSHTLDFWFTYALYAGIQTRVVVGLFVVLLGMCGLSIFLLRRTVVEVSSTTEEIQ